MQQNILTYSVLFMVLCLEAVSQQIPLEYDLDGLEEKASGHNFAVLSASNATVADATISNSTWVTAFGLQGFAYELVGGASDDLLVINDATQVVPDDINMLLNFSQLPAFAVVEASGVLIQATNSAGVLHLATGNSSVILDGNPEDRSITIGDLGGYVPRDAYASIAVGATFSAATAYTSQLKFKEGINTDLFLDTDACSLTIGAKVVGSGNGVFTTVVAATDSLNRASADWQCDGTADQEEIALGLDWIHTIGGITYLMEGSYAASSGINLSSKQESLMGSGWNTIIYREYSGDGSLIYSSDKTHAEVSHLTLSGKASVYNDKMKGMDQSTYMPPLTQYIHDVRVLDFPSYGIRFNECHTHSDIIFQLYNTFIGYCGNKGTYPGALYIYSTAPVGIVDNVIIYDNAADGINTFGASITGKAYNNIISFSNGGIGIAGNKSGLIYGCLSIDDANAGMVPLSIPVVGNIVYSCGDSGYVHCDAVNMYGNLAVLSAANGIYVKIDDEESLFCSNLTIFGSSSGYFQYNDNSSVAFVANLSYGNGTYGVRWVATSYGNRVSENLISNNAGVGMNVVGPYGYICDNVLLDNGGTGSSPALIPSYGNPPLSPMTLFPWVSDNYIYDSIGTSPAISVVKGHNATLSGNYLRGKFGTPVIQYTNFGDNSGWRDVAQMVYPCTAGVFVLESSASVRIALADRVEPIGPLTVSSDASTNPVANEWAIHSRPELKEDIQRWVDRNPELEAIHRLRNCEIRFRWKGREEEQLGFDITHPEFPEHLKAYDHQGRAVGVNMSRMLADLYAAADYLVEETRRLREEIVSLRGEQ